MCITFFTLQPESNNLYEFVIAFNRDQQSKRQTDFLSPFEQDPNIYAGKDAISGGTWLGVNVKTGIMVFLTNYDLEKPRWGKSRGKLVKKLLGTKQFQKMSSQQVDEHIDKILSDVLAQRQKYSAFNMVVYHIESQRVLYICSELDMKKAQELKKNKNYGLCNCELDVIWPKTQYGLQRYGKIVNILKEKEKVFLQLDELMSDDKSFDNDPEKQSSIFVKPYFSQIEKAQRKTKSTFFGIVTKKEDKFEFDMREVSYDSNQQKSQVKFVVEIKKKKLN